MKHSRPDYNRIQDPEGKIPLDEPVFLIRGQDIVGPEAVEAWAELADLAGADASIIESAYAHASEMRRWGKEHGDKIPDLP